MEKVSVSELELSKLSVRKEPGRVLAERTLPALSLAAEITLLSLNLEKGGFLVSKRDVKRAVAAASVNDDAATSALGIKRRGGGRNALRYAIDELVQADCALRGSVFSPLTVADRGVFGNRLQRLRQCLDSNYFPEEQDRDLALLLAWSGVLARLLNGRSERIRACTCLRLLVPEAQAASLQAVGVAPIAVIAMASGFDDMSLSQGCDAFTDSFVDGFDSSCGGDLSGGGFEAGCDHSGFDASAGYDGSP